MSLKTRDEIRKFTAVITTEDGGDGGDGGSLDNGDDLSTLFTPEEVTQKKEALAAQTAEETRRAALTDEERVSEDNLKAEELAKNAPPEKYEFKIPEGFTADEEMTTALSEFAKENKLSQAQAQRVADLGAKFMEKLAGSREQEFEGQKVAWLDQAKKDPEIGADIALGSDSVAAKAFNTIATPELKAVIDKSGLGNNPEVLRMFYRLAPFMAEGAFRNPVSGAGLSDRPGIAGTVSSMFPKTSKKE